MPSRSIRRAAIPALGLAALAVAATAATAQRFDRLEPGEERSAGDATVFKPLNSSSFSHPSGNMSFERQLDFKVGDGVFRKIWVSSPSSTTSSDGLGPLFNARSCQLCHLKDGRGRPPAAGEDAVSLFLRLSVPPRTDSERRALAEFRQLEIPEPTYGNQLQNFAIQGIPAEGRMTLTYDELPVKLNGGEVVRLRKPTYGVADLQYGPMAPDVMLSPRIAPPMIGMGLLEAVPEADILANADAEDKNGDGIRGRPNWVRSVETGKVVLGRFGWKAGVPTVAEQVAHASAGDMGLSTRLIPGTASGECTPAQRACLAAPNGNDPVEGVEIPDKMFGILAFYSKNLGVPARRKAGDARVLKGKQLFHDAGCASCHKPLFHTRVDADPEQAGQTIRPYTDFLLHDMGPGLADNRPEGAASGQDWRTPPLWGIGLTKTVSGATFFLHDGRARSLMEAILWHGGEAQAARDRVVAMTPAQRADLLAFLESL
ncbi:MAG: di-heme oxidoredictase family protein [Alphaproteobacteria bacterium]